MQAGMADPAAAQAVPARRAWSIRHLLLALGLALPLLWQLGGTLLFDVDEGAFSEATREMLASGDWGHTTLDGADRFDKPIGVYWLQAASVSAFGLNPFALRLPSALACWAMALSLAAFAARRWGDRAGALAGVLTVTSLGYQMIGRGATADGLLNLLLVLSALDAWRYLEGGGTTPLRRAYAWVGLGLLVKGPIAILVPGAAVLVWCATSRRWRPLRDALLDVRGWALLLVLSVPWYAYALHRHGMAFVDGFLMRHNVERFTGTIGGHAGNPLYYVVILPLLAMPWAPLLVAAVARARRWWAEPVGRYLLGWAAFVIVFFSLASTKLPHYVLYGYAPLVLLMARELAQASVRLRRIVAVGVLAWSVLGMALPWLVLHFAPTIRDPFYHALLSGAPAPQLAPALVAVALVAAVLFWPAPRFAGDARLAAAAVVLALAVDAFALPWFGQALQAPVRHAADVAAAHRGPAVQWGVHLPSFSVYFEQPVPIREPGPGDMALTRFDRIPPADADRPRLFEERGVVLLGSKR